MEGCNQSVFFPLNLGFETELVEGDEFALGKRKYEKRKRHRSGGIARVQSILEALLSGCEPSLFLPEMHIHHNQTFLKPSLLVSLYRLMVGLRIRV